MGSHSYSKEFHVVYAWGTERGWIFSLWITESWLALGADSRFSRSLFSPAILSPKARSNLGSVMVVQSPYYCFGNFSSAVKHLLPTRSLTFKEANRQWSMPWDTIFSILFPALVLLAAGFIGIGWKDLAISRDNAIAGEFEEGKKSKFHSWKYCQETGDLLLLRQKTSHQCPFKILQKARCSAATSSKSKGAAIENMTKCCLPLLKGWFAFTNPENEYCFILFLCLFVYAAINGQSGLFHISEMVSSYYHSL